MTIELESMSTNWDQVPLLKSKTADDIAHWLGTVVGGQDREIGNRKSEI